MFPFRKNPASAPLATLAALHQSQLGALRAAIAELPPADRESVESAAADLRTFTAVRLSAADLAFTLVGLERAAAEVEEITRGK